MKKDRENFIKNKDEGKIGHEPEIINAPVSTVNHPTIKAAKWQRPKSR